MFRIYKHEWEPGSIDRKDGDCVFSVVGEDGYMAKLDRRLSSIDEVSLGIDIINIILYKYIIRRWLQGYKREKTT